MVRLALLIFIFMHIVCKVTFAAGLSCQEEMDFISNYTKSCDRSPQIKNLQNLGQFSMTERVRKCQQDYQKNNCEELRTILEPEDHNKIANCDSKDLCKGVGQMAVDMVFGCPMGGVDYVLGLNHAVDESLKMVAELSKKEQECSFGADSLQKKTLMFALFNDSVPGALRVKMPPKDALEKMRCNEIRSRLFDTTRERSRQLSTEYDRARKLNLPIRDEVKEFLAWEENSKSTRSDVSSQLLEAAKKELRELNIKTECYNIEAYTEMVCRAALQIALGVYEFDRVLKTAGLAKKITGYSARLQKLIQTGKLDLEAAKRVVAAEKALGRELTESQMQSLEKAHKIGTTEGRVQRKQGAPAEKELTDGDIKRKIREVESAGFTRDEAIKLLEQRVLGQAMTGKEARAAVNTHRLAGDKAGAAGNVAEMQTLNARAADAMEVVIKDAKYAKSSRDYAEAARLNAHAERYDKAGEYFVKAQDLVPPRERAQAIYEVLNREKEELRVIAAKNASNPTYKKYYEDHRKLIEAVVNNPKIPLGDAWKRELLKP